MIESGVPGTFEPAPAEPDRAGMIQRVTALAATLASTVKSAATERGQAEPAAGKIGDAPSSHEPLAMVDDARDLAHEREPQLYEQAALASPTGPLRLEGLGGRCGAYVRRWCDWVTSGLSGSPGDWLGAGGDVASTRPRRRMRRRAALA